MGSKFCQGVETLAPAATPGPDQAWKLTARLATCSHDLHALGVAAAHDLETFHMISHSRNPVW